MLENLPSLLGFQPKFHLGGPARFYLPLLYDLVAGQKPKSIVTLGFGDGQAFFTFCQAAREQNVTCLCAVVRRGRATENESDDVAWNKGKEYGQEFYGDLSRFFSDSSNTANDFPEGSVDLLLLDDCDSGTELREQLSLWASKLAPNGLLLVHGVALERVDEPKAVWREWSAGRPAVEFQDGMGLGLALFAKSQEPTAFLIRQLFSENRGDLFEVYRLAVARMTAQARADQAIRAQAALEARQVWIDSILADRWKAQEIMDHQGRTMDHQTGVIAHLEARAQLAVDAQAEQTKNFELLHRDRAQAQLVMDAQLEQLKHWTETAQQLKAERNKLKAQVKEQKEILKFAKDACRKKGRCFQVPGAATEKRRRSFSERILREIKRAPRNILSWREPLEPDSKTGPKKARESKTSEPVNRYAAWMADHEPGSATLEKQGATSQRWAVRPKISLLVPVFNTPGNFLEEMLSSVARQTYQNWELCLVDGGSTLPETLHILGNWTRREPRIRFERLRDNFGIAENTNSALKLATGDFIACIDHDDLLAPFALYELARAMVSHTGGDIFYSDEDRLGVDGKRHSPFFKPDWSPEFLYSFMYLGHLTAYRRTLVDRVGGFRKEFDLSQDYDFALRATEQAGAIIHVPSVLYHWREHPASGSTGGKPEARASNLAALSDAMVRRGLPADIVEYPTANRVRLKVSAWPKVSIIVPTDSAERARACVEQLPQMTSYPDYEIVFVTNSALAELLENSAPSEPGFRFVHYDQPFNFSDKCNLGAQVASGARLIFFNDDVESEQPDWIQNLIEPLGNPEVGAVAPKLLYRTGKIQHAGLVTGVRGLVGTACHEWPADSVEYTNFAQSMRDAASLSAACLAMRRDDFMRIDGFDAINTPIAHSDFDLCFKIREAGLRCVYTPYVTLNHAGHVSISVEKKKAERRKDKASIYLLKRWARYTTRDPYFTDNMRDWLYLDSPTPIRMSARDEPASIGSSPDLLFVSHDLSLSGAPILLLHLAIWCKENGMFVVVMAPEDGPLREKYEAAGIPLVIDPLIMTGHKSFVKFARDFDCVLANTIRSEPVVRSAHAAKVPVVWWVHETKVGEHYLREDAKLRSALALADVILAPSERTASVYRPFTQFPIRCSFYGIPDAGAGAASSGSEQPRAFRFLVLGSIEPRKGQDVFLEAVLSLPAEVRQSAEFHLLGRVIDSEFGARVETAAAGLANLYIDEACDHREALEAIRRCDALVCSSRDEAMPVTILEALSLGKAIISTKVGGVEEVLADGRDALLVRPEDPEALAGAMQRLLKSPALAQQLGRNARETFEGNFTMDRFGEGFAEIVQELASSRNTA